MTYSLIFAIIFVRHMSFQKVRINLYFEKTMLIFEKIINAKSLHKNMLMFYLHVSTNLFTMLV